VERVHLQIDTTLAEVREKVAIIIQLILLSIDYRKSFNATGDKINS
jgi:hypothetical protein